MSPCHAFPKILSLNLHLTPTLILTQTLAQTLDLEPHLQLADEGDVRVVHDDKARRRRPRLGTNGEWLTRSNSKI